MPNTEMACRRCENTTRAPRRGLCTGCYWHARKYDELADYTPMRNVIDLDELAWLRSAGYGTHQIAARLGVTTHAIWNAEARARTKAGECR